MIQNKIKFLKKISPFLDLGYKIYINYTFCWYSHKENFNFKGTYSEGETLLENLSKYIYSAKKIIFHILIKEKNIINIPLEYTDITSKYQNIPLNHLIIRIEYKND